MNQVMAYLSDSQNQMQFGLTMFALMLSFVMRWIVRRGIKRAHLQQKHKVAGQIVEFMKPLFVPLFALILMAFIYFALDRLQIDADVIKILSQFILIWLVLAALHVSTNSRFAQWSIVLFIIPIIGLGTSGLLKPFTKFLDSFYFKLGGAKVSLYSVILSVVTFIILIWIARLITRGLDAYLHKFHTLRASNRELILKAATIALYFVVGLSALEMLGIDLTALAVFGGAIGVGVGFGLQKITSNFISGIILLFEKSVEVDDLVELADGTYGFIRHTGARATLVETTDGKEIMIPNEDFITSRVTNWTYSNTRGQVEMIIGVSYQSDLKVAQKLMLEAAAEHPRCSKHPDKKPLCHLTAFADASVQFKLSFWVDDVKLGRSGPKSDVMFNVWDKFKQNNITIPYPNPQFFIKELPKEEHA